MKYTQHGKVSQPILIIVLIVLTLIATLAIWFSKNNSQTQSDSDDSDTAKSEATEEKHDQEGEIALSTQQIAEQGLKFSVADLGLVDNVITLPGKLVINTDQQAHVSPNFSGHVEQVNVALGQKVNKGEALAVLSVPELIDQQANLKMSQSALHLAQQDYQREQQLWAQGISAKQDLQRAENAYQQARITVQSTQAKLRALGSTDLSGRFTIRAPISGVISQKDIVIGENVQLADQVFVIEQLKELWLEFNLPIEYADSLHPQQNIQFMVNGSKESYTAVIQSLTTQADAQTGRLVVRSKILSESNTLRPNVMTNVFIAQPSSNTALRIEKSAVQSIEGKNTIFLLASEAKGQVHLKAQNVELGQISGDGKWVEVLSGISKGQKYITEGSFVLKSELEKDEADHGH